MTAQPAPLPIRPPARRRQRLWAAGLALLSALALPAAAAPARVVSINLCTDQLAMMLAAPGQLVSVTRLARDPAASVMAEAARAYPANRGQAEEVYLLHPDLVLAGRYTAQPTVAMLRRLGIPVAVFEPADSFADMQADIARMGALLGREPEAAAMAGAFAARLARIRAASLPGPRPLAATWSAQGYMSGHQSLAGEILTTAGFDSLAARMGRAQGSTLPLEALVLADPDLVVTGRIGPGSSRAEAPLTHPALRALTGRRAAVEDRDWICGLPSVLDATERLGGMK
ncbi:ABC transporter substrate-binding protein [Rhodobacter capsulatus]|jgi:iron complex transport system substrate-binding protein|uniref:Iron siderophore/cobalamin ABC transporter, periplasmic iron siderophore/cobalamin-binding protein n=1 Tax=Rhodobacter capsulatus (strain ATCC BAA-309 / NBRC 16581 / SB1003) TaxID=272942 RepID=D5AS61_RHOCB|nr:ABC transporter substrate-binding protein [Rhodobacter capsulatus]ADE87083.1 iron siderophore/cobalamin ABC transporter, periplasmic iron siderophore/cobalamin-binding protein [Rhodobacter capsulatus SB 1003]ETD00204.1 cobalamin ABC transporter substrate-binding protein [Rhodobacter capsulatus DE442]ETD74436.1 cobalamin ABC transporter substrate-binding protein [Rhodobacter capsulatus R121]ETE52270.1 cobalamin ABC transporter substrate-binding protein [Rhodobacter capsulatus Y262]MDS0928880